MGGAKEEEWKLHREPKQVSSVRASSGGRLVTGGPEDPFSRHVLPLFAQATDIAIVAAFVLDGGLTRIAVDLHAAVRRGARVRIITGDYLDVTQVAALERLLDWQESSSAPDDELGLPDSDMPRGSLETRIIEVESLPGLTRSFHPKSWRFESGAFGTAFVGSSNLSRSALDTGIEWNLRVDRDTEPLAYAEVTGAFDALWNIARELDEKWIAAYAQRARENPHPLPAGEVSEETLGAPPQPHDAQIEALTCLREGRLQHGWRSALVVFATGLGKTWLATFDYAQLHEELGARPRLLFLAHRQELLRQAAHCYRRLLAHCKIPASVGWFVQERGDISADLVFASVQKLAHKKHLAGLAAQRFDYVVVDEVHHAAAPSYRAILNALQPRFLLGLTATPDRADAADIQSLFDDRVAYTADIARGIALGRLVPFHYLGVRDAIDYDNIPWRNRRFDPAELARAVQTEARMQTLWQAWREHPGTRTLVFCCSIAHADFVRGWLTERGVRCAAVFSGPGTDDRDLSIRALEGGELDALCSVDVLNEGVDVPSVDRVIMLRPTESGVIFLQQLGRGLRAAAGKMAVTVIDFVGNHRIFLERLHTLLSLAGKEAPTLRTALELDTDTTLELPGGCSVELQLDVKQVLSRLFRVSGADEVERAYRELRLQRGERPRAGELERMGYRVSKLRPRHASWFDFVQAEGDLSEEEANAIDRARAFLSDVEMMALSSPLRQLVALEALVEEDGLAEGTTIVANARCSHSIIRRSPELFADLPETQRMEELSDATQGDWVAYWQESALRPWTDSSSGRRPWFSLAEGLVVPQLGIPRSFSALVTSFTGELLDYRFAQYRARKRSVVTSEGFVCRLTWNKRDPILKLPSDRDKVPRGETEVWIDGSVWLFRFQSQFCNVARPAGAQRNQLPDLLRRWFGASAGHPGTKFDVRFRASPDGLWLEPVRDGVAELTPRRGVVTYPDLRAAAGRIAGATDTDALEPGRVVLPVLDSNDELFAVRVSGTSMDGGSTPMRDGDWAVMKPARSAPGSTVEGRVVLVQVPSSPFGMHYQIKRLIRRDAGWLLASDNPQGPTFEGQEGMTIIARLEHVFAPEALGPARGSILSEAELAPAFGLDELLPRSGRQGGHLFVFIEGKEMLVEPDRVRASGSTRPSETAFVCARRDDGQYTYLGVGHLLEDGVHWAIQEVDRATWKMWGSGRGASRRLPDGTAVRAQLVVDAILRLDESARWLEQPNGNRARVLGAAAQGGLRIDGAAGGFKPRTVSVTDIAWVIAADEHVKAQGGLLDEPSVNRARYLDGTPKGATRWIDTGWALAAWQLGRRLVSEA